MKTAFNTSEIAHVFFHAGDNAIGRCPANMSFRDGVFFSYSTPIWWRREHNGHTVHFRNTTSYSVSTSRHQRLVHGACPWPKSWESIITLWNHPTSEGRYDSAQDLARRAVRCRIESAKEAEEAACKPRIREETNTGLLAKADLFRTEAVAIATRFGLPAPVFAPLTEEQREQVRIARLEAEKREKERRDAEKAEKERTLALVKEHVKTYVTAWREKRAWVEGENLPSPVRAGAEHGFWQMPPVFRINGGMVESSKGALVPLLDFTGAVKMALFARKMGNLPWTPPTPNTIGIYHLDRIDDAGVHVGCHHVTWDEVETCAEMLGL